MQNISIRERFARISEKLNSVRGYEELEFADKGHKIDNLSSRISSLDERATEYSRKIKKRYTTISSLIYQYIAKFRYSDIQDVVSKLKAEISVGKEIKEKKFDDKIKELFEIESNFVEAIDNEVTVRSTKA